MRVSAKMRLVENEKIVAVGDVVIDDVIVIHDVKCMRMKNEQEEERYTVVLPNRRVEDEWRSVMYIRDKELWKELNAAVLASVKESAVKDHVDFDMKTAIRLFLGDDDLRAYATVVINDALEIQNVRIKEKDGKEKVVFPYRKGEDGIYSLAGPASRFLHERMEAKILEDYHLALKEKELSAKEPIRSEAHERSK